MPPSCHRVPVTKTMETCKLRHLKNRSRLQIAHLGSFRQWRCFITSSAVDNYHDSVLPALWGRPRLVFNVPGSTALLSEARGDIFFI